MTDRIDDDRAYSATSASTSRFQPRPDTSKRK